MSMALTLLPWQQFLPENNCGTADTTWAFIVWRAAEKWNTRFAVYASLPFLPLLLVTSFFLSSTCVLRNVYLEKSGVRSKKEKNLSSCFQNKIDIMVG